MVNYTNFLRLTLAIVGLYRLWLACFTSLTYSHLQVSSTLTANKVSNTVSCAGVHVVNSGLLKGFVSVSLSLLAAEDGSFIPSIVPSSSSTIFSFYSVQQVLEYQNNLTYQTSFYKTTGKFGKQKNLGFQGLILEPCLYLKTNFVSRFHQQAANFHQP